MTAKRTHKYIPPASVEPIKAKEMVLVVDDEKIQRDLLTSVLSADFRVDTAESVAEAVVKAELIAPSLVIMDYSMPTASGIEGIKRLREIYPKLPIVMLTGHADVEVAKEAMRHGAVEYALKPFEPIDLKNMVSRLVDGSGHKAAPLAEIPYALQRRMSANVDLWRSRLPTITSENRLCATLVSGQKIEAKVLRLNSTSVQAELYAPSLLLESGVSFEGMEVWIGGRIAYKGLGSLRNVISTGPSVICEIKLNEGWVQQQKLSSGADIFTENACEFVGRWREMGGVRPAFRQAISEIQNLLFELRDWLGGLEVSLESRQRGDLSGGEGHEFERLLSQVEPLLTEAFDRFEKEASDIPANFVGLYAEHVRSRLHPLMLAAPFVHRSFTKPLNYPGDFEVMNFMLGNPFQGDSVYARVLNAFVVGRGAPAAYRFRVEFLEKRILDVVSRASTSQKKIKILSLGCGAAPEVRRALRSIGGDVEIEFTLLDFSDVTLNYTRQELTRSKADARHGIDFNLRVFSVQQMLASGLRLMNGRRNSGDDFLEANSFDLVYCAGLFDYLSDRVCARLLSIFKEIAVPGGAILASNFAPNNPDRAFMDYILDWRLICRNVDEMKSIVAESELDKNLRITKSPGDAEIFVEAMK